MDESETNSEPNTFEVTRRTVIENRNYRAAAGRAAARGPGGGPGR